MNISVSEPMKAFIESQVAARGYGTASEYVQELTRGEQDRQHLRSVLLAGAESAAALPVDANYFDSLRGRIAKKVPHGPANQPAARCKPANKATRRI